MKKDQIIGIVGGVGPYAGVDLANKIHNLTDSDKDQNHLSIAILSMPGQIEDRTSFLLGETDINPAIAVSEIIKKLESIGATIIGIPCNSMHSPEIFGVIQAELRKANSRVKLLNMIHEVVHFIQVNHPNIRNVGVLSTTGLYKMNVYKNNLEQAGFNVLLPPKAIQDEKVHKAIYDPGYGIKAHADPVTEIARKDLHDVINYLQSEGTEAIVLGCTEICLAFHDKVIADTILIDSTLVLAKALIREAASHKLKIG